MLRSNNFFVIDQHKKDVIRVRWVNGKKNHIPLMFLCYPWDDFPLASLTITTRTNDVEPINLNPQKLEEKYRSFIITHLKNSFITK